MYTNFVDIRKEVRKVKKIIVILLFVGLIGVGFKAISNHKVGYDVLTASTAPSITLVSKTTNAITVSWVRLSGASGYTVYCDSIKKTATPITATSYTISGLTANTNYSIQVSAWHEGSEGSKNNILSVTTKSTTSSTALASSSQIVSSSTSSKNSATQAAVSSESVGTSQAVSSNDTITQQITVNSSEITTAKSSNLFSFTDMSFWLPTGIVLLFILAIIILLIVTRKKRNRL